MPGSEPHAARLTIFEAVLPIVAIVVFFAVGTLWLGSRGEVLIVVLMGAAAVAGGVARRHGIGWEDIQRSTAQKLAAVLPALIILLAIGMLIASWVYSGTIPFLVYWGVELVQPRYLVVTAFLATAVMSTFTGTSWGSAGTIGVAFVGTAAALGAPLAATAGAVVSGAYFGDKMSPLSDTTNVAAISAEAPLYEHIRHMLFTAVPSFVLALIVYSVLAFVTPDAAGGVPESASLLLADLQSEFSLSPLVLLPLVVVVWGIVRRVPPALAIALSSIVALLIGVLLQGFAPLDAVVSVVSGFAPEMVRGSPAELSAGFVTLVGRGGLNSMAPTLVVILAAFLLAGAMDAAGALDLIVTRMLAAVRSVFGLIVATMASGLSMIALTSHAGVTALVIGGLFRGAYADRGLAPVNLSRSIEDSVTITEVLMPWTVSAVFMATTLGVRTVDYAPWAVFCYGGPVFSLLLAAMYKRKGIGIRLVAG